MNERIRLLADQAEDYADSIMDQGGEFHPAYTQRLAELIVQECVKIAYQNDIAKFTKDGYRIGLDIQKHFGVEE
jgi:hypothetical protein